MLYLLIFSIVSLIGHSIVLRLVTGQSLYVTAYPANTIYSLLVIHIALIYVAIVVAVFGLYHSSTPQSAYSGLLFKVIRILLISLVNQFIILLMQSIQLLS